MKRIAYLCITLLLVSCGAGKSTVANNTTATAQKTKVITSHKTADAVFKTMSAKLGVDYKDDSRSQSVTMDLRMEKGKQIWLSARVLGLTVAKVYITRDRVQFYEKLNNKSFDGDFKLISEFLGEDLNFDQLEAVLLGQAVENLNKHSFATSGTDYLFTQSGVISKLFKIRASDFKVSEQSIKNTTENSFLIITYPEYQAVNSKIIPSIANIEAFRKDKTTTVGLEFKNVEFNTSLSFPFEMPTNTKPITF